MDLSENSPGSKVVVEETGKIVVSLAKIEGVSDKKIKKFLIEKSWKNIMIRKFIFVAKSSLIHATNDL